MSKKINIGLLCVMIGLLFAPFFETEVNEATLYVNSLGLLPSLNTFAGEHGKAIFELTGNFIYFSLFVFPLIGIITLILSETTSNEKKSKTIETVCYVITFIGFVFSTFSITAVDNYDLSWGYLGYLFVYLIIGAMKILDILSLDEFNELEICKKRLEQDNR